jgi:hypothetical protein
MMEEAMRIAIIGAGNLGAALGRGWSARGHEVVFGVRDPGEGAAAVKGGAPVGTEVAAVAAAARRADVVVLAVPAGAVTEAVRELGGATGALDGVIVIDATNPVGPGLRLTLGPNGESQGERTQALVPRARVVKSFNQVGAENIAAAAFAVRPVMFVAGDDAEARRTVARLADDLDLEAVDVGALTRARKLEHMAMLWIALSASPSSGLGRRFAFALVRPAGR